MQKLSKTQWLLISFGVLGIAGCLTGSMFLLVVSLLLFAISQIIIQVAKYKKQKEDHLFALYLDVLQYEGKALRDFKKKWPKIIKRFKKKINK